ncbi:hypothetical protein Back11_08230 [Paenibacillus baekrokdamisoli]|uniref:Uncharacterized protein n=1 Tax=Paenibacillus baekrokdamisoli TaxID=1712516 RepID=A0A3G9J6S2_9BACL|nr:hypothetical protein [Paenibacillus baekrokdamisoli]MBB3067335.1 hypothetical protein [Paenibacillus baekrokdamisoli]BBH19478.1 hypothetical protein Back11_08230 [Paenibacillus baekrokdamisoli]
MIFEGTIGGVKEDWLTLSLAVPVLAAGITHTPILLSTLLAATDVAAMGTTIPTYYTVTSAAVAEIIMKTGELKGSATEVGQVFVWTTKPTFAQAKNSGARSLDVVLEFQLPNGVTGIDRSVAPDLQSIARYVNGPAKVTNVKQVNFK